MIRFIRITLFKNTSAETNELTPKTRKRKGYFLELDDDSIQTVSDDMASAVATVAAAAQPTTTPTPQSTPKPATAPAAPAPTTTAATPQPPAAPQSTPSEAPQPVVAKPKPAPEPTVKTFAPDYLMPTSEKNSRRRPGANMNAFLDMARQVKTPKS